MSSVRESAQTGLYAIADAMHVRLKLNHLEGVPRVVKISGENHVTVVYKDLFDLAIRFDMKVASSAVTPVGDVVVLLHLKGNLGACVGYDSFDESLRLVLFDYEGVSLKGLFEGKSVTSVQSALSRVEKQFKVVRSYVKDGNKDVWLEFDRSDYAEIVGA